MSSVSKNVLFRLALRVEDYVKKSTMVSSNEAPERDYGYLVVMECATEKILILAEVGDVPLDKMGCMEVAIEKCRRTIESGELSSWATRDFLNKCYGGGIGGVQINSVDVVVAFSGLKEYADESVCVAATRDLGMLEVKKAAAITAISSACTDYTVTTTEFLEALQAA